MAEEKRRRLAAGAQDGFMLQASVLASVTKRITLEVKQEIAKIRQKYNVYKKDTSKDGSTPASIEDAMVCAVFFPYCMCSANSNGYVVSMC